MAPIKSGKRTGIRVRAAKSLDPRGKYAPPFQPDHSVVEDSDEPSYTSQAVDLSQHTLKDAEWRLNKQDKRAIKHNTLMNKVREGAVQKKKVLKRRRPGKKLVGGNLGDLADALPSDDDEGEEGEEEWEGMDENGGEEGGVMTKKPRRKRRKVPVGGRMEMKSLSMRRGAMKRKAEMEGREKERFGRNLAKMVEGVKVGEGQGSGNGQAGKWAALRAFIGSTMETDKAFAGKV